VQLLAVHAHPDDETLSSGALLAAWARAGHTVTLVTCTRGERGEVIGAGLSHLEGDGLALAAHREHELAAALAALGVQEHHFLDALGPGSGTRYEDSGMAWVGAVASTAGLPDDVPPGALVSVPLDSAAGHLAALVVEQQPALVVTYDAGGGYGHPDHVRAHQITVRALEIAAPRLVEAGARPPLLLCPTVRSETLREQRSVLASEPWARDLAARAALVAPDPDGDLPAVASDERQVALEVDLASVLGPVTDALRAHSTQVHAVTHAPGGGAVLGAYALSNDVLAAIPVAETYALLAGERSMLDRVLAGAVVPGVRAVA